MESIAVSDGYSTSLIVTSEKGSHTLTNANTHDQQALPAASFEGITKITITQGTRNTAQGGADGELISQLLALKVKNAASAPSSGTTLTAGDIAFIGYNTFEAEDAFTFIALATIAAGTEIYFTDDGWNGSAFINGTTGVNGEAHLKYTVPSGGLAVGDIVKIFETSTDGVMQASDGGTVTREIDGASTALVNFSHVGDQILAYQSSTGAAPANPAFIAGIHADYIATCFDSTTKWNDASCASFASRSALPSGLTNGTNAVSISPDSEYDNGRYTGTVTGDKATLLPLINDVNNWERATSNVSTNGNFDIAPSAYPVSSAAPKDFGDAPDTDSAGSYPTNLNNGASEGVGASHEILSSGNPYLGDTGASPNPDAETDGQPNATASGDDGNGTTPDDEEGISNFVLSSTGAGGGMADVKVGEGGSLSAWVDFNANGNWTDTGEQIFSKVALGTGFNGTQSFNVPAGAALAGKFFSRWRLCDNNPADECDSPTGNANDGEVEDHLFTITPQLSVDDVSLAEGDSGTTDFSFTVTLDKASNQTVTVTANTADGDSNSATATTDYTSISNQTVTFVPGDTSETVTVSVLGDTSVEANESFKLVLTSPSNASLSDGEGLGTINDDDNTAPTVANPIADQTATEDSAFSFVVPSNVFADANSGDTETLSAKLSSGAPLPGWLSFTPNTRSFAGTPSASDVGTSTIRVTSTDSGGATASDDFDLIVSALGPDLTPDPFGFLDPSDVTPSTVVSSNTYAITGIDACAPLKVTGAASGQFRIAGGAGWTSATNLCVNNNDIVQVRHTSSAANSTATTTTLCIGPTATEVCEDFVSTTVAAADTTPDAFDLVDQTDVPRSTRIKSNYVTPTGFTVSVPVTIVNGEFRIGGENWTTSDTLDPGETIRVRHTSSADPSTMTTTTLTIGGVSADFVTTTEAGGDTTPDPFGFPDKTGVATSTWVASKYRRPSGFSDPVPVTISPGSEFQIGGAAWATTGILNSGQPIRVRHTSSGSANSMVTTTLTIGGVAGTFTSTTAP